MDDEEENDTAVTGKIIRSYLNKDEKEIVLSIISSGDEGSLSPVLCSQDPTLNYRKNKAWKRVRELFLIETGRDLSGQTFRKFYNNHLLRKEKVVATLPPLSNDYVLDMQDGVVKLIRAKEADAIRDAEDSSNLVKLEALEKKLGSRKYTMSRFSNEEKDLIFDMIEKGDEGEIHSVVESKDPALNFDKNRAWKRVSELFSEKTGRNIESEVLRKFYRNNLKRRKSMKNNTRKDYEMTKKGEGGIDKMPETSGTNRAKSKKPTQSQKVKTKQKKNKSKRRHEETSECVKQEESSERPRKKQKINYENDFPPDCDDNEDMTKTRSWKELENVDPASDPVKQLIKRILTDLLSAKHATEESLSYVKEIEENEEIGDKSYLVLSLEHAVSLLDNSFKLGLVTIKENVELALKLAGEDPIKAAADIDGPISAAAAIDGPPEEEDGSKHEIMDSVDIICKLEEVPEVPEEVPSTVTSEEHCDSQDLTSQCQTSDNKEEKENSLISETDIDTKEVEVDGVHLDTFICGLCEGEGKVARFSSLHKLNAHVRFVHESVTYVCNVCNQVFPSFPKMRDHKRSKHPRERGCDRCLFTTTDIEEMKGHKRRHEEEMPNKVYCDECDYVTSDVKYLKKHKTIQHRGVRFACDRCPYMSQTKEYLKIHIASRHEGVRKKCDECDHTTTTNELLKKHKQHVHQGFKYYCDQCSYSVLSKHHLTAHILNKHEGLTFNCEHCEYTGSSKWNLREHVKKRHKS